jgi:hypothetical protein
MILDCAEVSKEGDKGPRVIYFPLFDVRKP